MSEPKHRITVASKTYIGLSYLMDLETLAPTLTAEAAHSKSLLVPFVLMCAAALEAILNDEIVSWAQKNFSADTYKRIADALLSVHFRGKLEFIVPLTTDNIYVLRTNSVAYKTLSRLITRRNELMHSKSYYHFNQVEVDGDVDQETSDHLSLNSLKQIPSAPSDPFHEVSLEECLSYYEALDALETKFLYCLDDESITENDMIMRNPK